MAAMTNYNSPHTRSASDAGQQRDSDSKPPKDGVADAAIAVLSSDAALRELLGGISTEAATVHLLDDWAALLEALASRRCNIVLLDADEMEASQLDARLAELGRLPVSPLIISAASRERGKESLERLHVGMVHRLLLKPATLGAVRLAIDYAIARVRPVPGVMMLATAAAGVLALLVVGILMLRSPSGEAPEEQTPALALSPPVPERAPVVTESPAASDVFPDTAEPPETGPDPERVESLALASIEPELAVAGLTDAEPAEIDEPAMEAEVSTPVPSEPDVAAPVTPAVAVVPAPVRREIDRLLDQGNARLQAGELIEPQDDSAFSYFRRAAAVDASDAQVLAMGARLREAVFVAARQALELGDTDEAEALLEVGAELGIGAEILASLTAQAQSLKAQQQAAREEQLLNTGRERLRQQRLMAPAEDSAAYYLSQLRAENPDHPGLNQLLASVAADAGGATSRGEFDSARDLIALLRQIGADSTVIEPLERTLASARRQDEFLRVPAGSAEMQLLVAAPAVYPPVAMRRGIEGWVDIDFIVDLDGIPRDIEITAAEPTGVFDRAAVNAVSGYRYAPFTYEGNVYERRVGFRMVFEIN